MAEGELDDVKALLRRKGLQGQPELVEIKPEIRSAGSWHLIDPEFEPDQTPPPPTTPTTGTAPAAPPGNAQTAQESAPPDKGAFAPGMLLRQVTYFVPPAESARFQDWLFRNEPQLHALAPRDITYLGTYGVFGRGSTYTTFWRFGSFAAIQRMANAVSDPLSDFGGVLRVLQQYPQIRTAEDYLEQLYVPAGASGLLTPGVTRDEQPGSAKPPNG